MVQLKKLLKNDSEVQGTKRNDQITSPLFGGGLAGLSRRNFILGALSVVVAPASALFNKKITTNPLSTSERNSEASAMAIIDTHTHFFDPTRAFPVGRTSSISWPAPKSPLYKTTLPPDWEAYAKPLGMNGTVVVEASDWLEDNDWILMLAERFQYIVGFIGNLSGTAIDQGKAIPVWDDLSRFGRELHRLAKNPLFRGIRIKGRSVSGDLNGGRYPHFEMLAENGLVIDVLGVPVMDVAALAKAVPSLTIVVDHMFNIRGTPAPSQQWRSDILTLAGQKNIVMKVSGLVEGFDSPQTDPATAFAQSKGALDHVYQAFGPDRLIFGTNWPVSQPKGEMSVVKEIISRYFEPKGKDVLAKVFAGNAKKYYRYVDR